MQDLSTSVPTETWVTANWDEYIQIVSDPRYDKAKCYYHDGQLRIEMAPVGHDYSSNNTIIGFTVNLYAIFIILLLKGLINCSYSDGGMRECQPDLSYYLGENAEVIPYGTKIINLNQYPPPELAIELGGSSLNDDLERKKQLYEQLPISEYWVVHVPQAKLLAFGIVNGNSQTIRESKVLPGLKMSILEEALRRGRSSNQTQVGAWLMQQFQES